MHVHLVHAHPQSRSFGAAMRDTMRSAFESRGDLVTISDLYGMGFNPVASSADFDSPASSDPMVYTLEQRRACAAGSLVPDIRREVEHLLAPAQMLAPLCSPVGATAFAPATTSQSSRLIGLSRSTVRRYAFSTRRPPRRRLSSPPFRAQLSALARRC
jgi:Flavodoxin-like fold